MMINDTENGDEKLRADDIRPPDEAGCCSALKSICG